MAKSKAKTAEDRVRVCGKWQSKDYKPSAVEKSAYADKQKETASITKSKDKKK